MTATAARGKFPYRAHRTLKQVFYDEWMEEWRQIRRLAVDPKTTNRMSARAEYRAKRALRP